MKPLRIGIDARELLGETTGTGRYLGELLQRWTGRSDADTRRFVLYTPEPLTLSFPATETRVLRGGRGTLWEQTTLRRAVLQDKPDVFVAPAYTAPLALAIPLAVAIHDVSFSRHPEWFSWREGTRRHWITRSAARRAGVILTFSQFSSREIQDVYEVPESRIEVVSHGVSRPPAGNDLRRQPLVLYAGSIFNRRRLPDLIAAFALTVRSVPDAQLVIVGSDRTLPRQDLAAVAAAHGVGDRVLLRRYVPDAELGSLYATASAFAFLSEYEGFGLTPLEALAAGVPVVALDTPVAREVYGDAAVLVRAGDIDATADALTRLLTVPEAAAAQLARAPLILARYSWDDAAARTLAAIERIVAR
ncbi:MAG TPA: glycosyltransferase family 1 protein [Vicinamibacterales bacterium]|nr:glycosyltransferase family 1 protein [Vicinamibacterales bacterium]